jgi:hypothetical protein
MTARHFSMLFNDFYAVEEHLEIPFLSKLLILLCSGHLTSDEQSLCDQDNDGLGLSSHVFFERNWRGLHPYSIVKIKGVFSTLQDRKTNKTEKGKEPRSLNN